LQAERSRQASPKAFACPGLPHGGRPDLRSSRTNPARLCKIKLEMTASGASLSYCDRSNEPLGKSLANSRYLRSPDGWAGMTLDTPGSFIGTLRSIKIVCCLERLQLPQRIPELSSGPASRSYKEGRMSLPRRSVVRRLGENACDVTHLASR
jgi:hypothetical protein